MRVIHYMNPDADVTACGKRLTRMTLHSQISNQVTCEPCRTWFDTYPA